MKYETHKITKDGSIIIKNLDNIRREKFQTGYIPYLESKMLKLRVNVIINPSLLNMINTHHQFPFM